MIFSKNINWLFLGLILALIFRGSIFPNIDYQTLEVIDYNTMLKKAEYASINNKELRIGAFQLVEGILCKKITDELTRECIYEYNKSKDLCAEEILDKVDAENLNENKASLIVRQFNVCRL
jgi:hypothetical protein